MRTLTSEDVIDSRDIVARIEELEQEIEDWHEDGEGKGLDDTTEGMKTELEMLQGVVEEIEGYSEDTAKDGITLIRDSYFAEYARELAEEIGAIERVMAWPCDCIDWQQAARELQVDYSSVEIDGITYWYR